MSNKTTQLTIGNEIILVDTLPKEIRDSINFFDKINEDLEKATYQHQILMVAAAAMKNKIQADIEKRFKLQEEIEEQIRVKKGEMDHDE